MVTSSCFSLMFQTNVEMCYSLLKSGVSHSKQRDGFGCSPLHIAARTGNIDLLVVFATCDPTAISLPGFNGW
jgi:ankyrin repeat protein